MRVCVEWWGFERCLLSLRYSSQYQHTHTHTHRVRLYMPSGSSWFLCFHIPARGLWPQSESQHRAQSTVRRVFSSTPHPSSVSLICSYLFNFLLCAVSASHSLKQAEVSSQEMHISSNTFLKWKQIPLQSLSLSLSPSAENIPLFSPHVLHPCLLRHHLSKRARQLGALPPLMPASFALRHRRRNASGRHTCFVARVQSRRTRMGHTTRQQYSGAQKRLRPRDICPTMPIAIKGSKLLRGMKVAQVGMLFDRLWEHSRVPQRSLM